MVTESRSGSDSAGASIEGESEEEEVVSTLWYSLGRDVLHSLSLFLPLLLLYRPRDNNVAKRRRD